MPKIKIKDNKHRERNRRNKLWDALMAVKISIQRITEVRESYEITASATAIEQLVSPQVKNILRGYGFDPLRPHYLNAKKTVVVKYVDVHIAQNPKETIISSIENADPRLEVEDIIHLPTSPKTIKIKFKTVQGATIAQTEGLNIMNQIIQAKNIEEEIYIHLIPCYICYSYEHRTSECPTPDLKICSECGEKEHTYLECPNQNIKKCISCGNSHRTLAAVCSIRRGIIKKKTQEILQIRQENRKKNKNNLKPNQEDATKQQQVTPDEQSNQNKNTSAQNLSSQQHLRPLPPNASTIIATAIMYATYYEIYEPGSYQKILNETYELNGMPPVKLPVPRDPRKFLESIDREKTYRHITSTPAAAEEVELPDAESREPEQKKSKRNKNKKKRTNKRSNMEDSPVASATDSELEALMAEAEENAQLEYDEYLLETGEYDLEQTNYIGEASAYDPDLSSAQDEDICETDRDLVYRLTSAEIVESLDTEDTMETPKNPLASESGEFVVWKERTHAEMSDYTFFTPREIGVKLIGRTDARISPNSTNSELYESYDKKHLALVFGDADDVPFALKCMNEKRINLNEVRIRFYDSKKFKDMVEGKVPFTWDNRQWTE